MKFQTARKKSISLLFLLVVLASLVHSHVFDPVVCIEPKSATATSQLDIAISDDALVRHHSECDSISIVDAMSSGRQCCVDVRTCEETFSLKAAGALTKDPRFLRTPPNNLKIFDYATVVYRNHELHSLFFTAYRFPPFLWMQRTTIVLRV